MMTRTKLRPRFFVTQVVAHKMHVAETLNGFACKAIIDHDVIRFNSIINTDTHSYPNYIAVPRGSFRLLRAVYVLQYELSLMHRIDRSRY